MEQRYIDSLTEICGKANVFYEMADIERYLYDETEEYFDQKHVRIVLLSVREHMKKYLKFLNGPIRNWYQLFHEAAELVHVVRQSLQNRLLL